MNTADENVENSDEYVLIFEAPPVEVPEFRLYYDDKGKVITYTCEKLEGQFIVIDKLTFAESRQDIRVVDGKISRVQSHSVVCKLIPSDIEGRLCSSDDVSIIVTENSDIEIIKWKMTVYEL